MFQRVWLPCYIFYLTYHFLFVIIVFINVKPNKLVNKSDEDVRAKLVDQCLKHVWGKIAKCRRINCSKLQPQKSGVCIITFSNIVAGHNINSLRDSLTIP